MPTKIIFGTGSVANLGELIGDSNSNVLLIATKSMRKLGVVDRICSQLNVNQITIKYSSPLPSPEDVDKMVRVFKNEYCDTIIGVGGGSTIDLGKSVAAVNGSTTPTIEHIQKGLQVSENTPFYAIPTTAGTGSEVTSWATLWDKTKHLKLSLEHESMFPTVAIIDPELTYTSPKHVAAAAGMDALTQAVEAYWSNNSQSISDNFALKAIHCLSNNLESACNKGGPHSKNKVAEGSLMSGLAFSNTKTTICHSLSYPITAHYGISHGQAVAITLAPFLEWNSIAIEEKLKDLFQAFGCNSLQTTITKIQTLMTNIGLETRLSKLSISEQDLELILKEGFYTGRADNNPRKVNRMEARSILKSIL